jgi:hypothetical protein
MLQAKNRGKCGCIPDSLLPGCPAVGSQVAGVGLDGVEGHGGRSEKGKRNEERERERILWAGGGGEEKRRRFCWGLGLSD